MGPKNTQTAGEKILPGKTLNHKTLLRISRVKAREVSDSRGIGEQNENKQTNKNNEGCSKDIPTTKGNM